MFKSIHYNNFTKKIHLYETYNGQTSYLKEDYEHRYYISDTTGKSDIKELIILI